LEAAAVTETFNVSRLGALVAPCERPFEAVVEGIESSGLADVYGDELSWRRRWMRAAVAVQCPSGRRRRWAERAVSVEDGTPSRASSFHDPRNRLTAAERRVVNVIVGGSSTREAASALHLSEKTVESHLQRVYRKLDVHSRVQLAAFMHEEQP
jgi:DNA-binding CsgD family transcriptional regulator